MPAITPTAGGAPAWTSTLRDKCINGVMSVYGSPYQSVVKQFQSRVTSDVNSNPTLLMGFASSAAGTCVGDDCAGGEVAPDPVICSLNSALPFGLFKFCTPSLDKGKLNDSTNPCLAATVDFQNIGSGLNDTEYAGAIDLLAQAHGVSTGFLLPTSNGQIQRFDKYNFALRMMLWNTIQWMDKRQSCVGQYGNPSDAGNNGCIVQFTGLNSLIQYDTALYVFAAGCGLSTKQKDSAMPLAITMSPAVVVADKQPRVFYKELINALECYFYKWQGLGFGGIKPKLVVPQGYAMPLIEAFVTGSLRVADSGIQTSGSELNAAVQSALDAGAIRTRRFGLVRIVEDECLTTAAYDDTCVPPTTCPPTIDAPQTKFKIQVLPDADLVGGRAPVVREYLGYTKPDNAASDPDTWYWDGSPDRHGNVLYRYRATRIRKGFCEQICIESRPRLINQIPALTGTIGEVAFNAASCTVNTFVH
jgi:hypothetical protein